MSTDRLNKNFHEFLQSIRDWPTPTIEKSKLIAMLEELCQQNHELQHAYEDLPPSLPVNPRSSSQVVRIEDDTKRSPSIRQSSFNNPNNNRIAKKESSPLPTTTPPNIVLVKEGDLTVRKGSTILSPLLKSLGFKTLVYCELSYTYCENEKTVYVDVFKNRKNRKFVHKFVLDENCSFVYENKKDFQFKHGSGIESFTTESGSADTWLSCLNEALVRGNVNVEEIYENPEDHPFTQGILENILDTPLRPPPRPPRPTKPISPENIYVCLYDHYPTTDDPYELEFYRGDLLYILNTDGPNFYVGHRLDLPLDNNNPAPIGLIFKDYITPAYEKIS